MSERAAKDESGEVLLRRLERDLADTKSDEPTVGPRGRSRLRFFNSSPAEEVGVSRFSDPFSFATDRQIVWALITLVTAISVLVGGGETGLGLALPFLAGLSAGAIWTIAVGVARDWRDEGIQRPGLRLTSEDKLRGAAVFVRSIGRGAESLTERPWYGPERRLGWYSQQRRPEYEGVQQGIWRIFLGSYILISSLLALGVLFGVWYLAAFSGIIAGAAAAAWTSATA